MSFDVSGSIKWYLSYGPAFFGIPVGTEGRESKNIV
jgi:hypothetical protein